MNREKERQVFNAYVRAWEKQYRHGKGVDLTKAQKKAVEKLPNALLDEAMDVALIRAQGGSGKGTSAQREGRPLPSTDLRKYRKTRTGY